MPHVGKPFLPIILGIALVPSGWFCPCELFRYPTCLLHGREWGCPQDLKNIDQASCWVSEGYCYCRFLCPCLKTVQQVAQLVWERAGEDFSGSSDSEEGCWCEREYFPILPDSLKIELPQILSISNSQEVRPLLVSSTWFSSQPLPPQIGGRLLSLLCRWLN